MTIGDLIHHPDFDSWYKYFLDQQQKSWEDGWRQGYEAGRRDYFQAREEDWAELFIRDPWWIDKLARPSYMEMEERRYGPLPKDWQEPEDEEYPGEARRRARAASQVRKEG